MNILNTIVELSSQFSADSVVVKHLKEISKNTNSFDTWYTGLFTILSVLATIVTIGGIVFLFADFFKKRMSQKKQISIILDLMRHLMENSAILEIILEEKKNERYPIEGTMSRFATLDDDTDIGRLSVSADQYERLHNLSLSIRNYNSVVSYLDKHISDPNYSDRLLTKELLNIKDRSNAICDALFKVSEHLHNKNRITKEVFAEYIDDRYHQDKLEIENEMKEGKISRYKIVHKINGAYYSKLGLLDHYEIRITKQARKNLIFYTRSKR